MLYYIKGQIVEAGSESVVLDNHGIGYEILTTGRVLQDLIRKGQVVFTTFHQSMDYEDFVEGLKPFVDENKNVYYDVVDGIFKTICHIIYNHSVKDARLLVLLLNVQVVAANLVVEYLLGYVELGRCLLHRDDKLKERQLRLRTHHILKVERCAAQQTYEYDEWANGLEQRYSCCLYCQQLELFAEVSE